MSATPHRSFWLRDSSSSAARSQPGSASRSTPVGVVETDVVVVGGGIAGLTLALLLAEAGVPVVVVERHRLAEGTTGHTTAKLTALHGTAYRSIRGSRGAEAAAAYAAANVTGVRLVRDLVARHSIDCDLTSAPAVTFTADPGRRGDIEDELVAASEAGLPVHFRSELELPFEVAGAVQLDDSAHFHPWRYCEGLATALERLGGRVIEDAHAVGLTEHSGANGSGVTISLADGEVRAHRAVLTTHLPFDDVGGYFAKATASRSYAMAVSIAGTSPSGMYLSVESPTRSVRPLPLAEGAGLVIGSGAHRTGAASDTDRYYADLEAWGRSTFDVERVLDTWSAQDYTSIDEMPFVGRSPRRRRTFVATAFRKWGMSNGTASAILLADALLARDNPWADAFDARRVTSVAGAKRFVSVNAEVAGHFVADRIRRIRPPELDDLPPGDARVVTTSEGTVAAYRHPDGTVDAVDPTCTHLGCTVRWNEAETSWDCPCHASRFTVTGEVIEGPATRPLPRLHLGSASRARRSTSGAGES